MANNYKSKKLYFKIKDRKHEGRTYKYATASFDSNGQRYIVSVDVTKVMKGQKDDKPFHFGNVTNIGDPDDWKDGKKGNWD